MVTHLVEQRIPAPELSFIASCRDLSPRSIGNWLAAGWRDFRAVPRLSVTWGVAVWLLSLLMSLLAWLAGGWIMLMVLLTGFVFVAPLFGFALYSVSRQLHEGRQPSLRDTLRAVRRPFQNAMVFGLILLVVFLIWARAASMVHVFFPIDGRHDLSDILTFLAIGSAVGSLFAGFSFAASAFSLPMLANRDVDVVTAVVSSIHAVLRNKWTCLCWALLLAALTALGILTALLGLIVIIPWLGYASWHAYHAALDVSAWPKLPVATGAGRTAP